ncbi:MAG: hypothetical protein A2879_01815 [Omnitrophica WOR_2 bacterium RIFCSPHIGHO2_01_FULL_49_10]|nr:MAG: hypothetical protein A2879_01815 [Omnitrophica WOR_2 bacterium RIFCSPHIGHO2_01_FULL_49_10]OGX35095.1 MAG: hypothetical protein A3I43_05530 [Omnitrophica WOR_2 bacterium RIFCSPLOWO2_02_FULL_50_19]
MPKAKLSAIVLTKDSQDVIKDCLESLTFADEIVVIDDRSTDRTAGICKNYTDNVFIDNVEGFANKRNLGAEKAVGDWILQIDSDERVTPELSAAVREAVDSGRDYAGYKFRRRNYFLGHFMRYGGWYHYSTNLYNKGRGRYEGLVHERLVLDGPIGTIEEATEHRPFQNIAQFLERQNRYTVYEARDLLNKRGKLPEKEVIYNLTWKPLKLFLKFYLKKQGFREGMIGFIFSVLFSYVHFMKWTKYWELTYGQKAR